MLFSPPGLSSFEQRPPIAVEGGAEARGHRGERQRGLDRSQVARGLPALVLEEAKAASAPEAGRRPLQAREVHAAARDAAEEVGRLEEEGAGAAAESGGKEARLPLDRLRAAVVSEGGELALGPRRRLVRRVVDDEGLLLRSWWQSPTGARRGCEIARGFCRFRHRRDRGQFLGRSGQSVAGGGRGARSWAKAAAWKTEGAAHVEGVLVAGVEAAVALVPEGRTARVTQAPVAPVAINTRA